MRLDASEQRQARQRKIANEIQGFVPSKLIWKAQRPIQHTIVGEHDGIFERSAANQAHSFERFNVALKTEGSRTRQQVTEGVRTHKHLHFLLAH